MRAFQWILAFTADWPPADCAATGRPDSSNQQTASSHRPKGCLMGTEYDILFMVFPP